MGDRSVALRLIIAGLGVAASLGAGSAFAQTAQGAAARAAPSAAADDLSWDQRFTQSATDASGWADSDTRAALSWRPNTRWGVTLNVRDADRASVTGRDEARVGAFFQFTPRLRVGGEVSVEERKSAGLAAQGRPQDEASAGVKLESAFRF